MPSTILSDLYTESLLKAVSSTLTPLVHRHNRGRIPQMVSSFALFVNSISRHQGKQTSMETCKQLANNLKRLALGLDPIYTYPTSLSLRKDGIPKRLKCFSRFLNSKNPTLKAVAMTILNSYRRIIIEPRISYSDVLGKWTGRDDEKLADLLHYLEFEWSAEIRTTLTAFRDKDENLNPDPAALFTASPSGSRSLDSLREDAWRLSQPVNKKYLKAINCLFTSFNREEDAGQLSLLIEDVAYYGDHSVSGDKVALYAFNPEGGGKTRAITMANYFIQNSLKAMHDELMHCLSTIAEDYVYKQDVVSDVMNSAYHMGKKAYCYDMSGATDRFPRALQSYLLASIYGPEVAKSWEVLMCVDIHHLTNVLRFEVGQPMGLYGSFTAFSLAHHGLVRYCCTLNGINPSGSYIILGDDIVIFEKVVADTYFDILTKTLGVGISKHKSIVSRDTFVGEFCKRLFLKDKEITPLGSGLVAPVNLDVAGLNSMIRRIYDWGGSNKTRDTLVYNFIRSYVTRFFGKRAKYKSFKESLTEYLLFRRDLPIKVRKNLQSKLGMEDQQVQRLGSSLALGNRLRLVRRALKLQNFEDQAGEIIDRRSNLEGEFNLILYTLMFACFDKLCGLVEDLFSPTTCMVIDEFDHQLETIDMCWNVFVGLERGRKTTVEVTQEMQRQETVRAIQRLLEAKERFNGLSYYEDLSQRFGIEVLGTYVL